MMRWPMAEPKRVRRATTMVDEAQVEKEVDRATCAYFFIMDLAQGYRGHFLRDTAGVPILGPDGKPVRVDEGTQQSRGLPDRYLLPLPRYNRHRDTGVLLGGLWLEIKRPRIVLAGELVQERGFRRWEQEQFHAMAREAGDFIATVESASMALSYAIFCGYPIPAENVEPWDDLRQAEYFNAAAKPASQRRRTRKVPRRTPWGVRT
jgi:hypothetical protein